MSHLYESEYLRIDAMRDDAGRKYLKMTQARRMEKPFIFNKKVNTIILTKDELQNILPDLLVFAHERENAPTEKDGDSQKGAN